MDPSPQSESTRTAVPEKINRLSACAQKRKGPRDLLKSFLPSFLFARPDGRQVIW